MSEDFNPRAHVRTLRGRGGDADYLDVKWRIAWFRHDWPEGTILTEMVAITDTSAVFKAEARKITGGTMLGAATGHGSETAKDFGDFIEKAETKAIGRALNALGYGTQSMPDDGERIADAPVERNAPVTHQNPPEPPKSTRSGNVIPKTAPMLSDAEAIAGFYTDIAHAPDSDALYATGALIAASGIDDEGLRDAYRKRMAAFTSTS
jgi:hypothetical protein